MARSRKTPTGPGLYWATLDDGNGNVAVTVLRVSFYAGHTSFAEGAVCYFVDSTDDTSFEVPDFQPRIIRPSTTIYIAHKTCSLGQEVLVTWHGPVTPPASALKQKKQKPEAATA